jgi:hypothetical protein
MDDIEEINNLLKKAAVGEEKLDSKIGAIGKYRQDKDRSLIVQYIVRIYTVAIATYIFYLFYRGIVFTEDVSSSISEIIKVSILPILTLVIGYYFGTKKTE